MVSGVGMATGRLLGNNAYPSVLDFPCVGRRMRG